MVVAFEYFRPHIMKKTKKVIMGADSLSHFALNILFRMHFFCKYFEIKFLTLSQVIWVEKEW